MHALWHWLFIGNGDETFVYLLHNGPHWLFEISVNVVEFLLALIIFRPLAKRWVRQHDAKHHHSECEAEHETTKGSV